MEQLLIHLFGDFVLQTDKQALNKKKNTYYGFRMCLTHCAIYTFPFILLTQSLTALVVIFSTHFVIDKTNIVAYFIAIKNGTRAYYRSKVPILLRSSKTEEDLSTYYDISNFGFNVERPFAISIWLMIITDNTIHLIINYFAIKYL